MLENFPPLVHLMEKGHLILAFDLGRYLIAASLAVATIWVLRRTRFAARKIQAREATAADMRREVSQSVQSIFVYLFASCMIFWAIQLGWLHAPVATYGLAGDLALLVAIIVAHDAYFYWAHRTMHHPRLYKIFHLAHHRSVTPTPWAAYSFAIPESVVMVLFVPLWMLFFATPGWVLFTWLNFQIIRNVMGHSGFEFFPRWWLQSPLTRWINSTTHHDLHHNGSFKHNYGLYFTWWDKMMGTEHPRYTERFAEVTGRTAPTRAPEAQAASA